MPFYCNARYFLVTYSQCSNLCEWAVLDRFTTLGAECIIARELHEDLGLHLHCFVDFGRKFRSRKTDVFDVDGRHPNIQASRGTPEKGYDYAIKDGDVVAGGLERPARSTGCGKTVDLWSQIAGAESRTEFWELCEELDPKSMCCSFSQLQKFADWRFAEDPPVYESPAGFGFVAGDVDGRDDWLQAAGLGLGQTQLRGECILAVEGGRTGPRRFANGLPAYGPRAHRPSRGRVIS
nr:MAG: replication-associated protein [Giant panda Genomoviridae]